LTFNAFYLATLTDEKRKDILTRRRWCWFIFWGTAITGIVGFACKDQIEQIFFSSTAASYMLLITGSLLFLADRIKNPVRTEGDLNLLDAIVIGVVQGVSLIPGISRSGSTIAFGLFRGLTGETSARFSFLLSIPAIFGATLMELRNFRFLSSHECAVYVTGMVTACITGLFAIRFLLMLIKKRNLRYFSFYCWLLGLSVLVYNFLL
jgi:undecaprenyl-diphosphatase